MSFVIAKAVGLGMRLPGQSSLVDTGCSSLRLLKIDY